MSVAFPALTGLLIAFIVVAVVWSGVWKALALWRAARNNHLAWFIVMCIVNTLGILEIIYIFAISRRERSLQA